MASRDALVETVDPEAEEEARLRQRIDSMRSEIAALASELEELRVTLSAFEARYDARIGVLIVELDRLNLRIAEYERRIAALTQPVEDLSRIEDEIKHEFAQEHERIDTEEQEATNAGHRASQLPPEPPEDVMVAIRQLYRKLARDYHPDTARDDDERAFNEAAMRRINAAMELNDLDALRRLQVQLPARDSSIPGVTPAARIAWAVAELVRLEHVRATLISDVAHARATATFRLWERVQTEADILDRLDSDYRSELALKRERLDALITVYTRLAHETFMRPEATM